MPITGKSAIGLDLISHLRDIYSSPSKDELERMILEIQTLIEFSRDRRNSISKILDRMARMLLKAYDFRAVSIGLRGQDGKYRYMALVGHTKQAEESLRKLEYDLHDMLDYDRYPNIRIGRISQFNPVEAFPEVPEELKAHGSPVLPKSPRKGLDDFLPGDYIDIYMHGYEGELIGWIELLGTKTGKLPSRTTIRWLELIADISAGLLQQLMHEEAAGGDAARQTSQ